MSKRAQIPSTSPSSSLQPGCVPSIYRFPQTLTCSWEAAIAICFTEEETVAQRGPQLVRGKSELGVPYSKACAHHHSPAVHSCARPPWSLDPSPTAPSQAGFGAASLGGFSSSFGVWLPLQVVTEWVRPGALPSSPHLSQPNRWRHGAGRVTKRPQEALTLQRGEGRGALQSLGSEDTQPQDSRQCGQGWPRMVTPRALGVLLLLFLLLLASGEHLVPHPLLPGTRSDRDEDE